MLIDVSLIFNAITVDELKPEDKVKIIRIIENECMPIVKKEKKDYDGIAEHHAEKGEYVIIKTEGEAVICPIKKFKKKEQKWCFSQMNWRFR